MFSLARPLGRIPFVVGVAAANSAMVLATLVSFVFLPSGAGHIAVLLIMAALVWWWFSLHARRFAGAGKGRFWPGAMALIGYGAFAASYTLIAALWSVPEVQQEAFRTGGNDYTRHVETSAALIGLGRLLAGWAGAAGAIVLASIMGVVMSLTALASGFVSFAALVMPSGSAAALSRNDLFRDIPRTLKR
jgi:hypothetical protein